MTFHTLAVVVADMIPFLAFAVLSVLLVWYVLNVMESLRQRRVEVAYASLSPEQRP